MEQIGHIEQVLSEHNDFHVDVKAVCDLYTGDISISASVEIDIIGSLMRQNSG